MKAKFYVQFRADWSNYSYAGKKRLEGVKAVKLTQAKPEKTESDLMVEFELDVPEEFFDTIHVDVALSSVNAAVNRLQATASELAKP